MQDMKYKDNFKNLVIGFIAGLASLMPGVSGGTILVITQKYDRLLMAANDMMKLKFKRSEMSFLLWVMSGAVIAILSLTKLMAFLLQSYEATIITLFIGLILGGAVILAREFSYKKPSNLFCAIGCLLFTAPIFQYLTENVAGSAADFPIWYLLLGGAFAAFCWVLPGISGSATLVMLGLYQPVMNAVTTLDLKILLPMGIGVIIGGVLCVKLLVTLFDRYREQGMATLFGLTLGGVWGLVGYITGLGSLALIVVGILISLVIAKALS